MHRILLVDDDRVNLRVLEAFLKPFGYELILAHDGLEALDLVEQVAPDLILLDVMMPKLDGYEVARRIKQNEHTQMIPIVMVTALSDVDKRVIGFDAGADDFLTKPVDRIELLARVRSLIKVKEYNDHLRNHRERLEREVQERTKDLKIAMEKIINASLDTIYRLATAADYRDDETGAHIRRMSLYSAAVARAIGLSAMEADNILHAAPMHDVGKIGIPDAVLLKPGKLSHDEWVIMKAHTVIGQNILKESDSEIIRLAEVIALNHHERWDGSGYPGNLKGNDIPLAGRIVAIADVFDALMSERPYKEAYPLEKSLRILQEEKGTHFDPDVVDAFFSVENEIRIIPEKYSDHAIWKNITSKGAKIG
jgi:putative two-component system response regulator